MALVGIVLLAITAPLLLPARSTPRRDLRSAERDFVVRMVVDPAGPIAGKTVEAAGLRHLEGVFLVEIERGGDPIAPVAPTTVLHAGDNLLFVGQARLILDLRNRAGLVSAETPHIEELETPEHRFFEAVVGANSPLLGQTPNQVGFRGRYQAAIVGVHREGQPVIAKLGEVRLRLGDTLLLLADSSFRERWRDRPDFLVITPLDGDAAPPPIAMATASQVGADPRAFAIAVAISASNSFLTPIGHQTNTMVYGPGGYHFSDYVRLGAPLTIASVLTVVFTA
jgi:di/tricarboxylate transporter